MQQILFIGAGGFIGAILRYGVSEFFSQPQRQAAIPMGTLVVNILGCFLIGLLSQVLDSQELVSAETRSFLLIGFLGAFTTFSTYQNDSFALFQDGKGFLSLVNILIQLPLGFGAIWLGRYLPQFFAK